MNTRGSNRLRQCPWIAGMNPVMTNMEGMGSELPWFEAGSGDGNGQVKKAAEHRKGMNGAPQQGRPAKVRGDQEGALGPRQTGIRSSSRRVFCEAVRSGTASTWRALPVVRGSTITVCSAKDCPSSAAAGWFAHS